MCDAIKTLEPMGETYDSFGRCTNPQLYLPLLEIYLFLGGYILPSRYSIIIWFNVSQCKSLSSAFLPVVYSITAFTQL